MKSSSEEDCVVLPCATCCGLRELMDTPPLRAAQPVVALIATMQTAVLNMSLLIAWKHHPRSRDGPDRPSPLNPGLELVVFGLESRLPLEEKQNERGHPHCGKNCCAH